LVGRGRHGRLVRRVGRALLVLLVHGRHVLRRRILVAGRALVLLHHPRVSLHKHNDNTDHRTSAKLISRSKASGKRKTKQNKV
jgi:hypothetical protein